MPTLGVMADINTYDDEDLIPVGDAARFLGVSISALRDWDRNGKLKPSRTAGGHRRYRVGDLRQARAPRPAEPTAADA